MAIEHAAQLTGGSETVTDEAAGIAAATKPLRLWQKLPDGWK